MAADDEKKNPKKITIEGVLLTPDIIKKAKEVYQDVVAKSANYIRMMPEGYSGVESMIRRTGEYQLDELEEKVFMTAKSTFSHTLTLILILKNSEHKHLLEDPKVSALENTLEYHIRKIKSILDKTYAFDSDPSDQAAFLSRQSSKLS